MRPNFIIRKLRSKSLILLVFILSLILGFSCVNQNQQAVDEKVVEDHKLVHTDWSKNANIYEVNIRQYTKEGTIKAFEQHLPRLQQMGVKILWLMPIFPIGVEKRKGTLGSYYSIQDYKAVNPEFGTMEELKALVATAHEMGFKVVLDWVANHTSWDHTWIVDHPEWYVKDSLGNMVSPFDWSDVAHLSYESAGLRNAMIDALKFWVTEADVDGYRCDVASMVPTDFWEEARSELDKIKPVFMLAEAEEPEHHNEAFDMSYGWELHHIFNQICKGEKNANDIEDYYHKQDTVYPEDSYRMLFITNHDENSWNGTISERMGDAANAMAVLSYTLPGMPLIYSGQEVGLDKRLEFFEKDEINWDLNSPLLAFYTTLNTLKKDNEALWNGLSGGDMLRIKSMNDDIVYAFIRKKNDNRFFIITNLSEGPLTTTFHGREHLGDYICIFSNEKTTFDEGKEIQLKAWESRVYIKE